MSERHRGIGMTSQRTRERLVTRLRERGIDDPRVLEAMRSIPRHIFVDEALATHAYEDISLPIGNGQTISQPYTVARMTSAALEGGECSRVLEVGTGSGYQTAILATLCGEVYTIERLSVLLQRTRPLLRELNLNNIQIRQGDGGQGWPEHAPFDAILVTAAPAEIPEPLLQQLKEGGRLVIPVGGRMEAQELRVITRRGDDFESQCLEQVSFVPLINGAHN